MFLKEAFERIRPDTPVDAPVDTPAMRDPRLSISAALGAALIFGLPVTGDALAQARSDASSQTGSGASPELVAFAMPADDDLWRPDIVGQNGAYRFREVAGNCQITFAQNRGANAAREAGQDPRQSMNAYMDGVARQVGRLERVEMDALQIASGADAKVAFPSFEFAYVGQDGLEYQNRISAAWVGDVELLIIAACPVSEWLAGRLLIDAFIGKVSISHAGDR